MARADEGAFIEALIASERIGDWLAAISAPESSKQRAALQQLEDWVLQRDAYAEEAREAGAVPVLTGLLKRTDDEDMQNSAARVIAACSGPAAMPSMTRVLEYGGTSVAVCEGALGDGLGARVWLSAQALARTLVAAPRLVAGRSVLEVGAGVGLAGLLAARLGAAQVTLTDYEAPVLRCLRSSVEATAALDAGRQSSDAPSAPRQPAAHAAAEEEAHRADSAEVGANAGTAGWDPEDADRCDDLDEFLAGGGAGGGGCGGGNANKPGGGKSWDWDAVSVRRLDWGDAAAMLDGAQPPLQPGSGAAPGAGAAADGCGEAGGAKAASGGPPDLAADAQFEVIIGSDVAYERRHVAGLAAAIARHLAPSGRALLCCPIREQEVLDAFLEQLAARRLALQMQGVVPLLRDGGIADQSRGYEGGFRLFAIQHEDAPELGWPWSTMLGWQPL